jgi:hypothetical protein
MKNYFTVGKHNIGYVGDDFKEHFGSMEFTIPKKLKLQTRTLERSMSDKEVLVELRPKESNLGELAWALKNDKNMLKNGYANIFYIRDEGNTLWVVYAYWLSDYREWFVLALSVENPFAWSADYQVLSQVFGEHLIK